MNCLLVSCSVLYFFPETHETVDMINITRRGMISFLLMISNDYNIKLFFSIIYCNPQLTNRVKLRKSHGSYCKHYGIIIVIFAA